MSKDKLIKLDIACGNNKQKGFIGLDITKKDTQADYELNVLTEKWPFEDGTVDEAFASHFLEHIPHGNGFDDPFWDFFNELYRVMKKGAKATFITPYYTSIRCWQDPTHQRAISEATYLYLNKAWRKANGLHHYPIKCNFEAQQPNYSINPQWAGRSQDAMQSLAMTSWNVVDDISVTIVKK